MLLGRTGFENVRMIQLLLRAGTDPNTIYKRNDPPATALDMLRLSRPEGHPAIAILELVMAEPERNALLIRLRLSVVA